MKAADARREFLFNYRFGGEDWGIKIYANNSDEAKEKITAVALARYEGEVHYNIDVPGGKLVERIFRYWFGMRK